MVVLAFSLQDQVEKYGAYVGIASFFGLAVLSLLYFAQAREVRRLRDWAGRSPERAQELEERVVAQAESVRRVPQPAAVRPQPAVAPRPAELRNTAPAANGSHKLKPEQVAALAFARAAGVAEPPHPPRPAPVPAPQPVAVGAEATVAAPPAAPQTGIEPVPANGNGHGRDGDVPAPATPAARRVPSATPPPPRRPAPERRAPSGPPPRRETSTRSVVLTSVIGVIVLAALIFAATQLFGGSDKPQAPASKSNPVVPPGGTPAAGNGSNKPKPTPTPARATTTVTVLNGTPSDGLAANLKDRLTTAGYADDHVDAGNDPQGKGRQTSQVLYKRGASAQAKDVARVLDIQTGQIKQIDAQTQAIAPDKSVVVEVGADKSGN
ncbi:LytR C-terminal domain-containing protein [Candidatus Solirubrobacter pratensis]|uniref:LytR C-terminal domain-containing protein n=1 Tax=Candidatus Solirubrobacter pratensis TaxID=1298857 RepID=UPI000413CF40|nr:LytR C-terminal domain-containing protein [Candidatus Solirubrobacter pratensis]